MMRWLRLQAWKYRQGLFFWQWVAPAIEYETFLVEAKKGQGKSRYLAGFAALQMRRGVRVCSNFTIVDRLSGARSVPIENWLEVLEYSVEALREHIPTLFVIDEFHLWADARKWAQLPDFFKEWVSQSRHYGVGLCGAVHGFRNVELRVRQLTDSLMRIRKIRLWKFPLYRAEKVDPESVDSMAGYELSEPHLGLFKWYGGYSTQELIRVPAFEMDEAQMARVAELVEEARALVKPAEFATFAGWEEARKRDRESGGRFDQGNDPTVWEHSAVLGLPDE